MWAKLAKCGQRLEGSNNLPKRGQKGLKVANLDKICQKQPKLAGGWQKSEIMVKSWQSGFKNRPCVGKNAQKWPKQVKIHKKGGKTGLTLANSGQKWLKVCKRGQKWEKIFIVVICICQILQNHVLNPTSRVQNRQNPILGFREPLQTTLQGVQPASSPFQLWTPIHEF